MEAARVGAKAAALAREHSTEVQAGGADMGELALDDFHHMLEPIVNTGNKKSDA